MILSLDLGGTNIKIAIFDFELNVIDTFSTLTNAELGFSNVLNKIIGLIQEFSNVYKIDVIGIGFPSVVLENGFVFTAPNLNGCDNVNIIEQLRNHINIPIYIDNDANVAALAEMELGSGIDEDSFLYVTLGTGVGGAIVYNRQLFKGKNCGAGEIGHLIISKNDINDDKRSYRKGILEEYLGRNQIIRDAKRFYIENNHRFSNIDFDVNNISDDADLGNIESIRFIESLGEILGIGIASVMNLLDIDCVIIGGGISRINNSFYVKLKETLIERTLPSISHSIKVHKAKYLNDAGIFGAAILAKYKFNKDKI